MLTVFRGCITPEVMHNWAEASGGDMELVDGYEEMPEEVQVKIKRALEQGHVDDEDFAGVRALLCHARSAAKMT